MIKQRVTERRVNELSWCQKHSTRETSRVNASQNNTFVVECVTAILVVRMTFSTCRNSILFREIYGDYIRVRMATKRRNLTHCTCNKCIMRQPAYAWSHETYMYTYCYVRASWIQEGKHKRWVNNHAPQNVALETLERCNLSFIQSSRNDNGKIKNSPQPPIPQRSTYSLFPSVHSSLHLIVNFAFDMQKCYIHCVSYLYLRNIVLILFNWIKSVKLICQLLRLQLTSTRRKFYIKN